MNKTEEKAYRWLLEQGYKGIVFRRRATPDFITEDGNGFEAKLSRNNVIYFGPNQLDTFKEFPGELAILVFEQEDTKPIALIPFGEIRHQARFWKNYRIQGWGIRSVPPAGILRKGVEAMLRLEEVAEKLGISTAATRMLILYEGKIPYFKVGNRGIRVREEDLENYIAKQKVEKEEPTESPDTREVYTGRQVLKQGDK